MPRHPNDSVQVAIRIPKKWLKEADEIAKLIAPSGFIATRTDGLRAAMARGIEVLQAEIKEKKLQKEAKSLDWEKEG